jgi:hypothetical protein
MNDLAQSDLSAYDRQVALQVAQHSVGSEIHDFSPIFYYWARQHIIPRAVRETGANSSDDFYPRWITKAIRRTGLKTVISIGLGDASVKVRLAKTCPEFRRNHIDPEQRSTSLTGRAGPLWRLSFDERDVGPHRGSSMYRPGLLACFYLG